MRMDREILSTSAPHCAFYNLCSFQSPSMGIWPTTMAKCSQCRREGGKPVQITAAPRSGRGPGTRLRCICFCLPRQYHYLSIVQINPFRPRPSHSAAKNQFLRFCVKIFSRSVLAGGRAILFPLGPNTLSAALNVARHFVVQLGPLSKRMQLTCTACVGKSPLTVATAIGGKHECPVKT
jgi:hypothetical protein